MRFNPYGISINKSLYVTGFTIFNNAATCTSSLKVSGATTLNNTTKKIHYYMWMGQQNKKFINLVYQIEDHYL